MVDVKPSNLAYGIIGLALIVTAFGFMIADFRSNGNPIDDIDNSTLESFNKMSEIVEIGENASSNFRTNDERSVFDLIGSFFKTGFTAVKAFFGGLDIFTSLSNNFVQVLNVPAVLVSMLVGMVSLGFLFFLISMVVKWRS